MAKNISKKVSYLIFFLFFSFLMSSWGGFITNYYKEPWYSTISKPHFNPPDWIFAPVWLTLYFFMAIAIWLIWLNPKKTEKIFYLYFIHLVVNASWSVAFFGLHQILVSLVIIGLIIFLVVSLIKLYYPINKMSAFLMTPYLLWLGYAFVLNFYIFKLN